MDKKPRRSFMGNYPDNLIHFLRFFHFISYKFIWSVVIIGILASNEIQQAITTGKFTDPRDLFVVHAIIDHLPISIPVLVAIVVLWRIGWEAEKEWKWRLNPTWTLQQQQAYLQNIVDAHQRLKLVIDSVAAIPLTWKDIIQPLVLRRDPRKIAQIAPGEVPSDEQREYQEVPPSTSVMNAMVESRQQLKRDNIIVLGDPGSGKTTLANGSLLETAKQAFLNPDDRIPIYLPLPELAKAYVEAGTDMAKALKNILVAQDAALKDHSLYCDYLIRSIGNGTAIVLLDSLDEVDGDYRSDILNWINNLAQTVVNRKTPDKGALVVTTRFTDYRGGDLKTDWFTE